MANDLPPYGILLVGEFQSSIGTALHDVHVIQGCLGGLAHASIDGELDVLVFESLGASVRFARLEVFCWPHEPVEGDDGEVNDGAVEDSVFGVI